MLPLVVTVTDPQGRQRTVAFSESPVIVGRGPFCQLRLDELWISRQEGQLEFDDDKVTYLRMNPNGATAVDGHELGFCEDAVLRPSSELTIGTIRIRARREPVAEEQLWRESRATPPPKEQGATQTMAIDMEEIRALQARREAAEASGSARPAQGKPPPGSSVEVHRINEIRSATPKPPVGRPSARPPAAPPRRRSSPVPPPPSESLPRPRAGGTGIEGLHQSYRQAWSELLAAVAVELAALEGDARASRAKELQRAYPQLIREPEFRKFLEEQGLTPHRPDVPELENWLRRIGKEVLPGGAKLESGFTIDRMIDLVTDLVNMYVDIRSAQDEVRRVALGKQPPRTVLGSNEASVILAYLLDPRSDWEQRVAELRTVIRRLIQHDFALTQATYEGARELLDNLAPAHLAELEGVELPDEGGADKRSFWKSLGSGGETPESRLWKRLQGEYERLVSGARYQRVFMGASFARKYRKVMGMSERAVLPSSRAGGPSREESEGK